jgi:hypothetical protein
VSLKGTFSIACKMFSFVEKCFVEIIFLGFGLYENLANISYIFIQL